MLRSRLLTVLLLTLTALSGGMLPVLQPMTVAHAAGTITGFVFRDYDNDGTRNPAIELGVGGITVTAYDSTNAVQGTTTTFATFCIGANNPPNVGCTAASTPALGSYTLNATGSGPYRIEFSGWPSFLQPAPHGANNATSVQFVNDGNTANVDFALHNPSEYCQANPNIAASCFSNGDPRDTTTVVADPTRDTSNLPFFVQIPYTPTGLGPDTDSNFLATGIQIGATWGVVYQRFSRLLFASAVMKRHSGVGPNGLGAIYRIDPTKATPPSLLVDLNSPLYAANPNISVGTDGRVAGDLSASTIDPNRDPNTFDAVGKRGIGGISFSEDEGTIWAVNMTTRSLLEIRVGAPAATPAAGDIFAYPIPNSTAACVDGEYRPWAIKVHDGQVYIGGVCSAELPLVGKNTDRTDLKAVILRFNPATSTFDPAPFFQFALDYPRGYVSRNTAADFTSANWHPWINEWVDIGAPLPPPDGATFSQTIYPQPILTTIEFDADNGIVVALMDRAGMQFGNENYSPTATPPNPLETYEGAIGSDVLRICVDPSVASGYSLENNGTCPGLPPTAGVGNGQGPGGGEFYFNDSFNVTLRPAGQQNHQEVTVGGMAVNRARRQVIVTTFDPVEPWRYPAGTFTQDPFRSGGFRWFNSVDGTWANAYMVFGRNQIIGSNPRVDIAPSSFGKTVGLGDIEFLCDQALIEIGNRVWRDDNANGRQDPGEPPLAGVTIELYRYDAAGVATRIGVTTTDANGNYYFTSGRDQNDANLTDNVIQDGGIGIRPRTGTVGGNSNYEIRIPDAAGTALQGPLNNLVATLPNGDATTNGDSRDSDGTPSGTSLVYRIPYDDLSSAGSNRHTYDFGFSEPSSLGNQVWRDNNNNGIIDVGEPPVEGVRVNLLDANGQPVLGPGGTPRTVTTDAQGLYLFNNLPPGDYIVELDKDNFSPGGPLAGFTSSTGVPGAASGPFEGPALPDADNNLDGRDDGNIVGSLGTGGSIRSLPITIAPQTEPLGETPDNDLVTPDRNENLTVDFGVFPLMSLGNVVWEDTNNNGLFDSGERPIAGVQVRLLDANGQPVLGAGGTPIVTTTNADGQYLFTNLTPGSYIVEVAASNFAANGPLERLSSSTGANGTATGPYEGPNTPSPDTDIDGDDNGQAVAGGAVRSGVVTLSLNSEPQNEAGGNNLPNPATDRNSNTTVDFGFYRPAQLGNFVWFDTNQNGVQDAGETGVPNVTVQLFRDANGNGRVDPGEQVGSTTTDQRGEYQFTNLIPGNYLVQFSNLPSGYGFTSQDSGGNDATDSDANPFTGQTAFVTINPGDSNQTLDAGIVPSTNSSLGDFVWFDRNENGVQEAGESGIAGVTVVLLRPDQNGTLTSVATTTTGINGEYLFSNLTPGDYAVRFVPPPGYALTSRDSGGNDTIDSDADLTNGTTIVTNIAAGENDLSWDVGLYYQTVALGNRIWNDLNNNGSQDANELGISSLTVRLYQDSNADGTPDGQAISTTTTDANGFYLFSNLAQGTYIVEVVPPAGFYSSSGANNAYEPAPDANNDIDGDDNGTTTGNVVRSKPITLQRGREPLGEPTANPNPDTATPDANSNLTVDFGFYTLSLGNLVWLDRNNNGVQDIGAGESGLAGVRINLLASDGRIISTTTTNASGHYLFTGLSAGDYIVELDASNFAPGAPFAGYTSSTGVSGSASGPFEAAPDSDTNTADSRDNGTRQANSAIRSSPVTLTAGGEPLAAVETGGNTLPDSAVDANSNTTVDFGIFPLMSLGNLVWEDVNNNGVLDAGERPLAGVRVNLLDGNGTPLRDANGTPLSMLTNASGHYLFTNLAPGDYIVELAPSNFVAGGTLAGYTSSTGLNGSIGGPVEPAPDADANTADSHDNGTHAGGGIRSSVVTLVLGDEPSATIEKDGNTLPDNASDLNSNLTVDFGVFRPAQLGNYVWLDNNTNGVQDAGEAGVNGVTVNLFLRTPTGNILVASTVTADSGGQAGFYQFTNLPPGNYIVQFTDLPSGTGFTNKDSAAGTDATDSDADLTTGITTPVTLNSGDSNQTIDAGLVRPTRGRIGNTVWLDLNRNGAADAGEPGVPGITVELLRRLPNSTFEVIATTITGAGGGYEFLDLPAGDYQVRFIPPANFRFTQQNSQAATPNNNSDADTSTGETAPFRLEPNQSNSSIFAGLIYSSLSLGNRVWEDSNNSGTQDADERGIGGLTVRLYRDANADGVPDGLAISTTTTDASGFYLFSELEQGTYIVEVVPPTGYTSSTGPGGRYEGTNTPSPDTDVDADDNGSTVNGLIRSKPVTLGLGQEPLGETAALLNPDITTPDANSNLTVDFGLVRSFSVGNRVWFDLNNNGFQDDNEVGIDGVRVELYAADASGNPTGALIDVQTTAGGGYYRFDNLPAGRYVVAISASNFASGGTLNGFSSSGTSGGTTPTEVPPPDADSDLDRDDNGAQQIAGGLRGAVVSRVITLGPAEPTGETDLGPSGQGGADNQSNMTIDFGFFRGSSVAPPPTPGYSIGNRIWLDDGTGGGSPDDGLMNGGESGIGGVVVYLYLDADRDGRPDSPTPLQTTTTDSAGHYRFDGLPAGNYLVEIPAVNFTNGRPLSGLRSSTGQEADANRDGDRNDNGIDTPVEGAIRSGTITLGPNNSEPTNETDFGPGDQSQENSFSNLTIDFGFVPTIVGVTGSGPLSLGNLVWLDTNNNGLVDAGETGIDGVRVNLYRDLNGNGQIDSGELVTITVTTGGGRYLFSNLPAGTYLVQLDPANFISGGPLNGLISSIGGVSGTNTPSGPYEPGADSNNDRDNDDNGTNNGGGVVSRPVVLTPGNEPTNDGDGNDSNLTVDFGLIRPISIGSIVWVDINGNGQIDAGEPGLSGVTVTLVDAAGRTIATTTTDANGNYSFVGITPGNYSVRFSPPSGYGFTTESGGDSDVNPRTGITAPIVIGNSPGTISVSAGVVRVDPTAIVLTSFTSSWEQGQLVVRWATNLELDTFGYQLYRSTTGSRANATLVTERLIAAKGQGGGGASYQWTDTGATQGVQYSYWLSEIEIDGTVTEYGPARSSSTVAATRRVYLSLTVR